MADSPEVGKDAVVWSEAWWVPLLPGGLAQLESPQVVSSPCTGFNSQARAAMEMSVPWQSVHMFDIEPALARALTHLTGSSAEVCCGKRLGYVTLQDPKALADGKERIDGLVAGPPCPPYSSIGLRLCGADARSFVFTTICSWLFAFLPKGLSWFLLENVAGILKKKRDDVDLWPLGGR